MPGVAWQREHGESSIISAHHRVCLVAVRRSLVLEKLCEEGEKKENEGLDDRREDDGSLPIIPSSLLPDITADGGRRIAAGASCPITPQFSEARNGDRGETQGADKGVTWFNSGEFMSREGIFEATMRHMRTGTYVAAAAAAEAILHVYVDDEQRLACVMAGGLGAIIDTLHMKAEQMQGDALAALLSLFEHPDVPVLLVRDRGLAILAEYLTTARDVATRYVALTIMKVALVCGRPAVEPFLPDMVVSEHVLGASEEVEAFVGAFVEKRKDFADYLRVGVHNLRRFSPTDIAVYKEMFEKVDKDGSGALDERELKRVLKQLKVDCTKESVRKVIAVVDKNRSGGVEFDEFLDVVWNARHVKGSAQMALLRTGGIFIGTAFTALRRSRF